MSTGTSSPADPVDATVTVPANALSTSTTISITEYPDTDPALEPLVPENSLSSVFRFSPEGLTFDLPVTITISYDDSEVAGLNENLLKVHLLAGGEYIEVPNCSDCNVTDPCDPCVSARDKAANTITIETTHFSMYALSALPNNPPVADAGQNQTASAGADCEAMVILEGKGSDDPDEDTLSYTWSGSFGTATGPTPEVTLSERTHTITLEVDDGQGETAQDIVVVTVEDTTAPTITASLDSVGQRDESGDSDEGIYVVNFEVTDICDSAVSVSAVLIANGCYHPIPVRLGQKVEFEYEDEECEKEWGNRILEIEASGLTLRVTATDASENTTIVETQPARVSAVNDNDDDRNGKSRRKWGKWRGGDD